MFLQVSFIFFSLFFEVSFVFEFLIVFCPQSLEFFVHLCVYVDRRHVFSISQLALSMLSVYCRSMKKFCITCKVDLTDRWAHWVSVPHRWKPDKFYWITYCSQHAMEMQQEMIQAQKETIRTQSEEIRRLGSHVRALASHVRELERQLDEKTASSDVATQVDIPVACDAHDSSLDTSPLTITAASLKCGTVASSSAANKVRQAEGHKACEIRDRKIKAQSLFFLLLLFFLLRAR